MTTEDKIYDVDVLITEDTPKEDTPTEDNNDFIFGPFSNFCKTFSAFEKVAQECGGGWAEWELYRCTYEFPNQEAMKQFLQKIIVENLVNDHAVNIQPKIYKNEY